MKWGVEVFLSLAQADTSSSRGCSGRPIVPAEMARILRNTDANCHQAALETFFMASTPRDDGERSQYVNTLSRILPRTMDEDDDRLLRSLWKWMKKAVVYNTYNKAVESFEGAIFGFFRALQHLDPEPELGQRLRRRARDQFRVAKPAV